VPNFALLASIDEAVDEVMRSGAGARKWCAAEARALSQLYVTNLLLQAYAATLGRLAQ